MNFRLWIERESANQPYRVLKPSYLASFGMSPARVRGKVLRLLQEVSGDFHLKPGLLGVLLDENSTTYIVAVVLEHFGIVPIEIDKLVWDETGMTFDGDATKLKKMSEDSVSYLRTMELKDIEDQLRGYPQVMHIFKSENQIRAILFNLPKGYNGADSPYQIILNTNKPGMVQVITTINGKSHRQYATQADLPEVVKKSVQTAQMMKAEEQRGSR